MRDANQRDGKLLDIVATAKWITHRQLSEIAKIIRLEKNDNRKVFEWRVRRLSELGLLKKQRPPFLNQAILYSITKNGIFRMELLVYIRCRWRTTMAIRNPRVASHMRWN